MGANPQTDLAVVTEPGDGLEPYFEARYRGDAFERRTTDLADEVPVALEYNGVSHAVMLATPGDLEDFAVGFSLTEGIIDSAGEIYGIESQASELGITVGLQIASGAFARLKERRRTLVGRTGCGICGTESLEQVLKALPDRSRSGPKIAPAAIARALGEMSSAQTLKKRSGAVHGAAWSRPEGCVDIVREDVGRHNALDKLIGAILRTRVDPTPGFAVVTSRASVEMVQKAARVTPILVAVSTPTRLAVRVAEQSGLTLAGSARGSEFSVYSHPWRISGFCS